MNIPTKEQIANGYVPWNDDYGMMDGEGYPSIKFLDWISTAIPSTKEEIEDFMGTIQQAWRYDDYHGKLDKLINIRGKEEPGLYFWFATGGWSGNESIANAMNENFWINTNWYHSWKRGGLYVYGKEKWMLDL